MQMVNNKIGELFRLMRNHPNDWETRIYIRGQQIPASHEELDAYIRHHYGGRSWNGHEDEHDVLRALDRGWWYRMEADRYRVTLMRQGEPCGNMTDELAEALDAEVDRCKSGQCPFGFPRPSERGREIMYFTISYHYYNH
jgi:hypothetical protein